MRGMRAIVPRPPVPYLALLATFHRDILRLSSDYELRISKARKIAPGLSIFDFVSAHLQKPSALLHRVLHWPFRHDSYYSVSHSCPGGHLC
jgi:hypothetical protein